MDFKLEFRNKVVNGDEITFDVGLDFEGLGAPLETWDGSVMAYYDYFTNIGFSWNKDVIEELDMSVQNNGYASHNYSQDILTTAIVRAGAKVNARFFVNALGYIKWTSYGALPDLYLRVGDLDVNDPSWEHIYTTFGYSHLETYNGGNPVYLEDGTQASGWYNPRHSWFGQSHGSTATYHVYMKIKIVVKSGQSIPSNLRDIFYVISPDDSTPSTAFNYYQVAGNTVTGNYLTAEEGGGEGEGEGEGAGEGESSGSYDWTHEGQLTNIVKFVRGQDLNGNPSYAYAKKEDDNTTTLYFTPDLTNFAAFNSYDSGASSIDGSPIFIEYGAGGKVLVGTDTGKVYQIELDEYSVPQSYALLHDVVGGHPINSLKYGYAMNQWIFEAGGDIYTIPAAGGGAVLRHSLPAGAKVVDFAEGDEGKVAFIVRMADFSIEPRMAPADWSVIYGPSSMVADASVATDFNYSHAMDLWVSSNADGSSIVTVSDLLDYLS